MKARLLATGLLAVALLIGSTQPAAAHVSVRADDPTPGSYTDVTVLVPNETDASTTTVRLMLPTDPALQTVTARPTPGWQAQVERTPLPTPAPSGATDAPSAVVWTASPETQLKRDEAAMFVIAIGPLPDVATLALPTTQTYSDGVVVAWDQSSAGGAEPERPAPMLELNGGSGDDSHPHSSTDPSGSSAGSGVGSGVDPVARGLGAGALVIALAGLIAALLRREGPS